MSKEPLSAADFLKFTEGFNASMESFKTSIGDKIHSEVADAIVPLQAMQKVIADDLANTKERVSAIETDNDDTKSKVVDLQKQMASLQKDLSNRPTSSQSNQLLLPPDVNPRTLPTPPAPTPLGAPPPAAVQVLREAKKILGFSPIRRDDIDYLKMQNSIEDDSQAMISSILEFLTYEMKVPRSITDNLVIRRVFPPAKPSSAGWSTLYAEFQDIASAELIQQYVRNLLHGKTVSIYVPHSLHPRYSAIGNIAHEYRNGEIKHKTKIKYGTSDFVLVIKPKNSNTPWSYVSLNTLPPLELSSFDGNPSSSPPPGRTRLSSKRGRSPSPESSRSKPTQKLRTDGAASPDSEDNTAVNHNHSSEAAATGSASSPPRTPPKSAPPTVSNDHGLFGPSACASPKVSQNQNFTFSLLQSKAPLN